MNEPAPPDRTCEVCGRRIEWRRKWARDWNEVKYCSARCRGRRGESRGEFEALILALLAQRARGTSICPSEVARAHTPDDWRGMLESVRRAARRLVARGEVVITQKGQVVDPSTARGAIRIRKAD